MVVTSLLIAPLLFCLYEFDLELFLVENSCSPQPRGSRLAEMLTLKYFTFTGDQMKGLSLDALVLVM